MERTFFVLGSISSGLAVVLGAFGAHILRDRLTADALSNFETAVRYHMYHGLALLAVAFAIRHWPDSNLPAIAGWSFVAGIVLFSGSLYLLGLTGVRWLGAVAPLGGAAFIVGWLCLALAAWKS